MNASVVHQGLIVSGFGPFDLRPKVFDDRVVDANGDLRLSVFTGGDAATLGAGKVDIAVRLSGHAFQFASLAVGTMCTHLCVDKRRRNQEADSV